MIGARVTQLGYLGFGVRDLAAWEGFATQVLGLGATRGESGLALRMDERRARFFLEAGDDDLLFSGWEVDDEAALGEVSERLAEAGFEVERAPDALAEARGVSELVRTVDPAGNPTEIYFGPVAAHEAFRSSVVPEGFVAGDRGLGHVVLRSPDVAASAAFYCDVLGLRPSDRIVADVYGHKADITFLHANPRHHSLGLAGPLEKRLHHFLVEVRTMDDVGLGFDRALRAGVRIALTIGRHPNDRMFSFYALTPSGFQFELGWGGREVDDATWVPTQYDRISEWGHHPPELLAPRRRPRPEEAK